MLSELAVLVSSEGFRTFLVWWVAVFVSMIVLNMRRPHIGAPALDFLESVVVIFGMTFALSNIDSVTPLLYAVLCLASIVPLAFVIGRQKGKKRGVTYWMASAVVYVMLVVLFAFAYTL